jgi:hypothetical protein
MSDPEDAYYPDLPPDGLGDLQRIVRLPGMQPRAPAIRWGDAYLAWPLERRLHYAERLASAMNHAADILQRERDRLLATLRQQDAHLALTTQRYLDQGALMHRELAQADAEKQALYREIGVLQAQLRDRTTGRSVRVVSHTPEGRI